VSSVARHRLAVTVLRLHMNASRSERHAHEEIDGEARDETSGRSEVHYECPFDDQRPIAQGRARSERCAVGKMEGTQELAAEMPFNATKAAEYGRAAFVPSVGSVAQPPHERVTASTITESTVSTKTGNLNVGAMRGG
jgi:hypothetical protein